MLELVDDVFGVGDPEFKVLRDVIGVYPECAGDVADADTVCVHLV